MERKSRLISGVVGGIIGLLIGGGIAIAYLQPKITKAQSVNQQEESQEPTPSGSSGRQTTPTPTPTPTPQSSTNRVKQNAIVLLHNGVVSVINGSDVSAILNGKMYLIHTSSTTKFVRSDGSGSSLGEISTNNLIDVSGSFSGSNKQTINASTIKDLSLRLISLTGIVTSTDSINQKLVITNSQYGTITVFVSVNTVVTDKKGKTTSMNSINTGDTITLSGTLDISNNTLISTTNIADLNISL